MAKSKTKRRLSTPTKTPLKKPRRTHHNFSSKQVRQTSASPSSQRTPLLPLDVLLNIFKHLTELSDICAVAATSSAWREAALQPSVWERVRAVDNASRIALARTSAVHLEYNCPYCFDVLGPEQCEYCTRPQKQGKKHNKKNHQPKRKTSKAMLTTQKPDTLVGTAAIIDLVIRRAGSSLRSIDISHAFLMTQKTHYRLSDDSLQTLAKHCGPQLHEFRATASSNNRSDAFVSFASQCPALRVLHIRECAGLATQHVASVIAACKSLEDLNIIGAGRFRPQRLDELLRPLCGILRRINVSSTQVGNLSVHTLGTNFPMLEHFSAKHCDYLTIVPPLAPGVNAAAAATSGTVQAVFPRLTEFHVDYSSAFQLSAAMPSLRAAPRLTSLTAQHVSTTVFAPQTLDPQAIGCSLLERPPAALRTLCLAGQLLVDADWLCLFRTLRHTLVECDLSACPKLSCAIPDDEPGCFASLAHLFLNETAITDESLAGVIARAPRLLFVDANGCRSVRNRPFRRDPVGHFRREIAPTWPVELGGTGDVVRRSGSAALKRE